MQKIIDILKDFDSGVTMAKITKLHNVDEKKLRGIIVDSGRELRGNGRKYTHDYDFFSKIDTHEKAYWLGFIFADGYVNTRCNLIGIQIHPKDYCILEAFKESIKATNPIATHNKKSTFGDQILSRIQVSHVNTHSDLIKLGVTPTKTKDGVLPTVEEEFKWSLLRGYLDGDGCILTTNKRCSLAFSGTKGSLEKVEEYVGIKFKWSQRHPERDNNNYDIHLHKDSAIVLDKIYQTIEYYPFVLQRKYDKYLSVEK